MYIMSRHNNNFISTKNKEFVWNLMYTNGIFSNVSSENYENVKHLFENKIINIENQYKNVEDLTILNKYLISEMINEISNINENNLNKYITSEELSEYNKNKLQNNFKLKQDEFTELINTNKPEEVNFSDKDDIEYNIDEKLEDAIKKRQEDLNIYFDEVKNQETNNTIKIDKEFNKGISNEDKHVSFAEPIENRLLYTSQVKSINKFELDDNILTENESFLSKLKLLDTSDKAELNKKDKLEPDIKNEINNILNKVKKLEDDIKNQNNIIELLKDNNTNLNNRLKENYENMDERIKNNKKLIEKLSEFNEIGEIDNNTLEDILKYKSKKQDEFWNKNNNIVIGSKDLNYN